MSGDSRALSPVKRAFDLILALTASVVLAPFALLIALGVRLSVGAPILFRQERAGLHGRTFVIHKFRTMRHGEGDDAARLTRFGRLLRGSSMDEIPQLLNILRGDMSFVGPRPLLPEYLPLYSARHARRHAVRPGVTGWSAVRGRNALTWEEQFECDIWYIEHWSMWLDLRILLLTVGRVLGQEGVNQSSDVTRERFRGV